MAMLLELMDQDRRLMHDGLLALVGGIHNLRQGQQAMACHDFLFRNNSDTSMVIQNCEILGWMMLICTGDMDKDWKKEVEKTMPTHLLRQSAGAALNHITTKGQGKPQGPHHCQGGGASQAAQA